MSNIENLTREQKLSKIKELLDEAHEIAGKKDNIQIFVLANCPGDNILAYAKCVDAFIANAISSAPQVKAALLSGLLWSTLAGFGGADNE